MLTTTVILAEVIIVGLAIALGYAIGARQRRTAEEFEQDLTDTGEFLAVIGSTEDEPDLTWLPADLSAVIEPTAVLTPAVTPEDAFTAAMRRADEFIANLQRDGQSAMR